MRELIISITLLVLVSTGHASLSSATLLKIEKGELGSEYLLQPLKGKAFSQHVTHFCLNQVEGYGLGQKFMTAYLIECAADYGVFNVVSK